MLIRVEIEGEWGWVEWPICANPDCPNLRCLWSGTDLCHPCATHELGAEEMARRYGETHPQIPP